MMLAVSLLALAAGTAATTCNAGTKMDYTGSGCTGTSSNSWQQLPCSVAVGSTECYTYQTSVDMMNDCIFTTVVGGCVQNGTWDCATLEGDSAVNGPLTNFYCTECSTDECNSMVFDSSADASSAKVWVPSTVPCIMLAFAFLLS